MSLYKILVIVHVFSAILGLGPGFILTYIVMRAKTMFELRHSFTIRRQLHYFVMIGGVLLLVTGIAMGILQPQLWEQLWYSVSLGLYLITLIAGPIVLTPSSKPVKQLLEEIEGEEIPEVYHETAKKLYLYEHILNLIFIIIIVLMITKPI